MNGRLFEAERGGGRLFGGKAQKINLTKTFKGAKKFAKELIKTKKQVSTFLKAKKLTTEEILAIERKATLKKVQEQLKAEKELAKIRKIEKEIELRKKVPFAP